MVNNCGIICKTFSSTLVTIIPSLTSLTVPWQRLQHNHLWELFVALKAITGYTMPMSIPKLTKWLWSSPKTVGFPAPSPTIFGSLLAIPSVGLAMCLCLACNIQFLSVCGKIITEGWGILKSPGYPDYNYAANEYCRWIFDLPIGSTVHIKFEEIDVIKYIYTYSKLSIYNYMSNCRWKHAVIHC